MSFIFRPTARFLLFVSKFCVTRPLLLGFLIKQIKSIDDLFHVYSQEGDIRQNSIYINIYIHFSKLYLPTHRIMNNQFHNRSYNINIIKYLVCSFVCCCVFACCLFFSLFFVLDLLHVPFVVSFF